MFIIQNLNVSPGSNCLSIEVALLQFNPREVAIANRTLEKLKKSLESKVDQFPATASSLESNPEVEALALMYLIPKATQETINCYTQKWWQYSIGSAVWRQKAPLQLIGNGICVGMTVMHARHQLESSPELVNQCSPFALSSSKALNAHYFSTTDCEFRRLYDEAKRSQHTYEEFHDFNGFLINKGITIINQIPAKDETQRSFPIALLAHFMTQLYENPKSGVLIIALTPQGKGDQHVLGARSKPPFILSDHFGLTEYTDFQDLLIGLSSHIYQTHPEMTRAALVECGRIS